jgi:hypothetical protein
MRKRRSQSASTAVAVLLLLAQAASLLHLLLVPHRRCAAHGEMVEGQAHAAHATAEAEGPSLVAAVSADDHDHCLLLALASTAIGCEAADPGLLFVIEEHRSTTPNSAVFGWGSDLFLLAPKTSPPV